MGDGIPGAEFPDPEAFDLQGNGAFLQRGLTGVDDAGVGGVGCLRDRYPRGIRRPRDLGERRY